MEGGGKAGGRKEGCRGKAECSSMTGSMQLGWGSMMR